MIEVDEEWIEDDRGGVNRLTKYVRHGEEHQDGMMN
jgi:hypothetical protein